MVEGFRFRVQSSGFRVQCSGFRVQDSVFRVQGSQCRVRTRRHNSRAENRTQVACLCFWRFDQEADQSGTCPLLFVDERGRDLLDGRVANEERLPPRLRLGFGV